MIAFDEYYNISAEDVEYISVTDFKNTDFPYRLTVHTKSGQDLTVNYKDAKTRDNIRADMVQQVEIQKRQESEKVISTLYSIKNAVKRIDRRELKIWRQLQDLLGIRVEED